MITHAVVRNLDRQFGAPHKVKICQSFADKLRGFMFRAGIDSDDGLLLIGERDVRLDAGIHMFFVSFDLAVFWINGQMEVVDRVLARAWHPAYIPRRPARYVMELHPSRLSDFELGNKVSITDA